MGAYAATNVSVDRGHRHSEAGNSEVCLWISHAPKSAALVGANSSGPKGRRDGHDDKPEPKNHKRDNNYPDRENRPPHSGQAEGGDGDPPHSPPPRKAPRQYLGADDVS